MAITIAAASTQLLSTSAMVASSASEDGNFPACKHEYVSMLRYGCFSNSGVRDGKFASGVCSGGSCFGGLFAPK